MVTSPPKTTTSPSTACSIVAEPPRTITLPETERSIVTLFDSETTSCVVARAAREIWPMAGVGAMSSATTARAIATVKATKNLADRGIDPPRRPPQQREQQCVRDHESDHDPAAGGAHQRLAHVRGHRHRARGR